MSGPKRYLVTGGAGFIGSHLCDALLAGGHAVVVLDDLSTGKRGNLDPRASLGVGDVADPHTVRMAAEGVDGVFHLAAIASVERGNQDWPGTHRINQGGTVAVLDAARALGRVPVVYASSAAVYGDAGDAVVREERMPAPLTAYGADKLGSELHARVASLVHGVPTLGLRFFNVYGSRQDPSSPYSGVISIFADRIGGNGEIILHGDGGQTRDFVHVSDVVAHLLAGMRRLEARAGGGEPARFSDETPMRFPGETPMRFPGETPMRFPGETPMRFNVCTGRAVSIRSLAEILAGLYGVSLRAREGAGRAGDIRHSCGSNEAAVAALGVQAQVRLEQGLATLSG